MPRYGETELQDNSAVSARNVKLMSTEIRPWRKPVAVHTVSKPGIQTIFKMDGTGGAELWCEWDTDTDVCYGPIADNDEFRIYYSEGGVCKKTNWALCSAGEGPAPRNWLYMGVTAPTVAPTVVATRTGEDDASNTEERVYCYTYVAKFGSVYEESAPSEATTVTSDITGGSVSISGFGNPTTDHENVVKIRIYRAVTGASSVIYLLVDELDLVNHVLPASGVSTNGVSWTNSTYVDTRTTVQLGKELDSLYYTPPPEGLKGLVSMPNGFLAGFIRNEVWFSEPYLPHAWPANYMLTTDSPIVGLGVYGDTLVVCTTRQPYTISGTHPSSMAQEKQPMLQPCVSKRSIAYDQYGVLYASPYGLVVIAGGQMDVFTRPIITHDEWADYNPTTMIATMYNNLYITAYRKLNANSMLIFSRNDEPALVNYDFTPLAMHVERSTGRLFCLSEKDNIIYQMDGDQVNKEVYEWISKRFVLPYATSFSAMKLDAEYEANELVKEWAAKYQEILDYNAAVWEEREGQSLMGEMNGHMVNTFEVNGSLLRDQMTMPEFRSVGVTLYCDGKAVYSKIFDSIVAVRIPPAKGYAWQVRISGNLNVRSFAMSTTMRELASPQG